MTPKEKIIKELDELGNVLYNKFGTDSCLERCTIHDLKTKIKALTLTDVVGTLCDNKVEVLTAKTNGVWYDGCKQAENA